MATRWPTVCLLGPTVRWFSLLDFLLKGLPVDTQDKVIQTYIVAIFSYCTLELYFLSHTVSSRIIIQLYVHIVFYFLRSSGTCVMVLAQL